MERGTFIAIPILHLRDRSVIYYSPISTTVFFADGSSTGLSGQLFVLATLYNSQRQVQTHTSSRLHGRTESDSEGNSNYHVQLLGMWFNHII